MQFQFSGDPVITASRQVVWERLTDPDFIAASAPGVESVEAVDPQTVRLHLKYPNSALLANLAIPNCAIVSPTRGNGLRTCSVRWCTAGAAKQVSLRPMRPT